MPRKRRTRQHVIEDLSINFSERQALLAGFAVDRVRRDYGIDIFVSTYDAEGRVESGYLAVQAKATDHLRVLADGRMIAVRVATSDLDRWLREPALLILALYDGRRDVAYWLDVQAYFDGQADIGRVTRAKTVTIHLPLANRLDASAFRDLARLKNDLLEATRHGE